MAACLILEQVVRRHVARDRRFELLVERFALAPGDVIAVVGPSGCGKSTLLDLCGLAAAPSAAGRLELLTGDGRTLDIARLWLNGRHDRLARLRARHLGYVLQTGGLLPFLDVQGNLELAQRLAGRRDRAHVRQLLEALEIADLARALPARLSVGQRQRVAVARALVHRPDLILADEPTAALDPGNARRVVRLLLDLARASGAGLLIVSHDHDLLANQGVARVAIASESSAPGVWHSRLDLPGPDRLGDAA
jgi:putative ABC transport system ATP-binding protein